MGPLRKRLAAQSLSAAAAVDRRDGAALVACWLALAAERLPANEQRGLGYRPLDRLSGFDDVRAHESTQAFREAVVAAVGSAAEAGDCWASWAMAGRCLHGVGVRRSVPAALRHARKAAAAGVVEAQAALGDWLPGEPEAESLRWCRLAAAGGSVEAAAVLAEMGDNRRWSALVNTPSLRLEWGAARYTECDGCEGWGWLPLPGSDGTPPPAQLVVAVARDDPRGQWPWSHTRQLLLSNRQATSWAASAVVKPISSAHERLRLGVAASLAEQLYEPREEDGALPLSSYWLGGSRLLSAFLGGGTIGEGDPVELARRLQLVRVLAHVESVGRDGSEASVRAGSTVLQYQLRELPARRQRRCHSQGVRAAAGAGGGGVVGGRSSRLQPLQLIGGTSGAVLPEPKVVTSQDEGLTVVVRLTQNRRGIASLAVRE